MDFPTPKRCPDCRKRRVYDARYEGWQDTMYQPKPHTRINHFGYHKY